MLDIPTTTLILSGVIGCVTAYIAIQQWLTAKNKLRLDLFDRRFPVFEATMRLAEIVVTKGDIPLEEVHKFAFTTKGVEFLFNRELQDYCDDQLHKEALAVHMGKRKIDSLPEGDERDKSTVLWQTGSFGSMTNGTKYRSGSLPS